MKQYKKVRLILMLLGTVALSTPSSAQTKPCFSNHIKESIKINLKMKKKYSTLTNKSSNRIYQELILSERTALKLAKHYDRLAIPYQKEGVNLFCEEFVPMEENKNYRNKMPTSQFTKFQWNDHHKRIKSALKSKKPHEIRSASLRALIELKKQPDYYCFTRHMLESIYRLAHFLPLREEEAKMKKLSSPGPLFYQIMSLHNLSLSFTNHLDHLSAPIQAMGVPILCHELPDLLNDLTREQLNSLKGI